jgi:quercetin dioxygenase-like cupin family protein/DNA-binding XRE family transcriptional regulator
MPSSTTLTKRPRRTPRTPAEPELAKTVGERLRRLRKQQRITLVTLAKSSGVDPATISRMETGQMTGTLESHTRLARALGVKLTEIYAGIEEARARELVSMQTASGRTEVYVHQAGKSSMAMLTTEVLKKKLMPVLITIEPGGSTHREETRVGTEKFLYVLEGELQAKVGETTHQLKRGSSLYFEASIPHVLKNAGSRTVRCLSVVTPPVL